MIIIEQIKRAISEDNEMVEKYPNKEVFYFCGDKSRKERILKELSSIVFYDYCHIFNAYGCYEILKLLLNKQIPNDIVKFYIENGNGGSAEIDVIALQYGIGKSSFETLQEVYEDYIKVIPYHKNDIQQCFKGFVKIRTKRGNEIFC